MCAQKTKSLWRAELGWGNMSVNQREALDLIATKVARILCGDPAFDDHWDDIKGYAELGKLK